MRDINIGKVATIGGVSALTLLTLATVGGGYVASDMALRVPKQIDERLLEGGEVLKFDFDWKESEYSMNYYLSKSENPDNTVCFVNFPGLTRAFNNDSSENLQKEVSNMEGSLYSISPADANDQSRVNGVQEYGGEDEVAFLKAFITKLVEVDNCKTFHFVAESLATPHIVRLLNDPEFKQYLKDNGVEVGVLVLNSPLMSLADTSRLKLNGILGGEVPFITDAILQFGFFFANNKTGRQLHTEISIENLNLANIASKVIVNVIKDDPTTGDAFVNQLKEAYKNANDVIINLYSTEEGTLHPATTEDPKIYAQWLNEFINQVNNYSNNLSEELKSKKITNKERLQKNNLLRVVRKYIKDINDFFGPNKPLIDALANLANNRNLIQIIEVDGTQYWIIDRGAFGIGIVPVDETQKIEA